MMRRRTSQDGGPVNGGLDGGAEPSCASGLEASPQPPSASLSMTRVPVPGARKCTSISRASR